MKKIKYISILSLLIVGLFLIFNEVFARPPFEGGGTIESPYLIETCEHLQYIANMGTSGDSYFKLNNNIDCSDTRNWNDGAGFIPIGYTYDYDTSTGYGSSFLGTFDGNNKTISGLYINRPTYSQVGLFGSISNGGSDVVLIKDLTIENADITAYSSVGILAGFVSGSTGDPNVISNVYTSGEVESTIVDTQNYNGTGGLIGVLWSSGIEIYDSRSSATVVGEDDHYIGGLVGFNYGSKITNSYATGDVTGKDSVGGLVGYNNLGHIENTYATGNVSGINNIGGLVGSNLGEDGVSLTIINSYSSGNVSGTSVVGGLIGSDAGDKIYNSYSVGEVSGVGYVGGLIGALLYEADNYNYSDYILNSGWYKSGNNSELKGIGWTIENGDGEDVSYTESNPTAFYSKNHGIYKNAVEYDWEFDGNPWYEYRDNYPKLTEPDRRSNPSHSNRSSGSSIGAISTFYQEQYQRALAVGADTTPYQEALNNLNPNTTTSPDITHRTLKQGMQGDDVKQLQIYLNTHNYPLATQGPGSPNNETTYFGNKTKQAVILFQKANNLTPDGVVGPLTWSYIK